MIKNLRDIYGPGHTRDEYLAALNAGYETGWWDDNGIPAPWPENFDENDNDWKPETNKINNPDQPPF